MSLMRILNRVGDITPPCGAPAMTSAGLDR